MSLRTRLEIYFGFAAHTTNWRTEILAGLTTFITMAYIIFVNPAILSETGMPLAAVTAATCLCAAFGSILMGALANYPLALAPGMGLNAYFTYTVVKGMGVRTGRPHSAQSSSPASSFSHSPSRAYASVSSRLFHTNSTQRSAEALASSSPSSDFATLASLFPAPPPQSPWATCTRRQPPSSRSAAFHTLIAILQVLRIRASMLIGVLATTLLGILFPSSPLATCTLQSLCHPGYCLPPRHPRRPPHRRLRNHLRLPLCRFVRQHWHTRRRHPACRPSSPKTTPSPALTASSSPMPVP